MRPARCLLISLALCTALAIAGCGGEDDEQTSAPTTGAQPRQPTTTTTAAQQRPEEQKQSSEQPAERLGATADTAPAPGTESAAPGVPVTPGGDNSIQTFGTEGEVDEREQAVATLQAYLRARAAGRWARACEQTSEQFKEQVALLISRARGEGPRPEDCPGALRLFIRPLPKPFLRRQSQIDELLSFRVEERDGQEYAYVIYEGAGGKVRFIAMKNDDGEWKVNVTEPSQFPSVGS